MPGKEISRNEPCPCGSGRKYKHCCARKGFRYVRDGDGQIEREIPLGPELESIFAEQRQTFIEKYGREPGPDDPVFQDLPHLEHLEHEMVQAMERAGVDPALIYAFEKTGRLASEENRHLLSDADLAEWEAAIEDYRSRHGGGPP